MKDLKLVVFDVDGTLVKAHSWQFLHEALDAWDEGKKARAFELFFGGNITYEKWAWLDASLWQGLPLERVKRIINATPFTYGAKETISILK